MPLSPRRNVRDPWSDVNRLQEELNRVFSRFGASDRAAAAAPAYPAINLWLDGDCLYVESELPGLKLDDLEIVITAEGQLSIKGRRNPSSDESAVWHRQERGYGEFSRTLQLPTDFDAEKVQATLKNGVLLLKLPKHAEAKARKIEVRGA